MRTATNCYWLSTLNSLIRPEINYAGGFLCLLVGSRALISWPKDLGAWPLSIMRPAEAGAFLTKFGRLHQAVGYWVFAGFKQVWQHSNIRLNAFLCILERYLILNISAKTEPHPSCEKPSICDRFKTTLFLYFWWRLENRLQPFLWNIYKLVGIIRYGKDTRNY